MFIKFETTNPIINEEKDDTSAKEKYAFKKKATLKEELS
jgi:hypothetical protein